jgi:hypothetical protein
MGICAGLSQIIGEQNEVFDLSRLALRKAINFNFFELRVLRSA